MPLVSMERIDLMLKIHEFWIELFPIFQQNCEFIYYFLDVLTIISLIRAFLEIPTIILTGRMRGGKW